MSNGVERDQGYFDFSGEGDETPDKEGKTKEMCTSTGAWQRKRGGEPAFLVQLHFHLSNAAKTGLEDIFSWQPHGRCFVVHSQKRFEHWFRQTKISSFQRQLNHYGFKRLTKGFDRGGYYHELFLRTKPFLVHRIKRKVKKGTGRQPPDMPRQEPNLYLYPFLPQTVFQVSGRRAQISDSSAGFVTTTKPESQGQVLPLIPVEDSRSLPKFVSEVCTNNQTVPVDRCLSTKIHDQSLLEESVRAVANSRSLPPFERAVPSTLALSQATYDSNIRMLLLLREEQAQAEAFEQTRVHQQLLLEANLLIGWRSERQSVWFEDGNCNRGHDCEMRLANAAAYQQQLSPQSPSDPQKISLPNLYRILRQNGY